MVKKKIVCHVCDSADMPKDVVALNKKLLGLKITRFYCLNCLAEYLEVTTDDLLDRIEAFKEDGCELFK